MTPEPAQARTIRMMATRIGDNEMEVTGHLVDERPVRTGVEWLDDGHGATIHDMSLTLRVRHPDLVVTAVSGTMTEHPYTLCPDALPPLQRLVGLSVARGFTRAVNERFGRQHGCAHLTALVHAMAPLVRQGAGVAFHEATPPSAARGTVAGASGAQPRTGSDPWFVNSCQAWREDGLLHRRLLAGDIDGMRALSARRRKR